MLTNGTESDILSERLARGHENLTKTGRNRGEPGQPSERDQKKCLTNASARGKLNEFAPEGANELEKEPKQAVRG